MESTAVTGALQVPLSKRAELENTDGRQECCPYTTEVVRYVHTKRQNWFPNSVLQPLFTELSSSALT